MTRITAQLVTEIIGIVTFVIFVGGYITSVEVRFSKQEQIDKIAQRVDSLERMLFEVTVENEVRKRLNQHTYGGPALPSPPDALPPLPDVAQIQKDVEERIEKRIQQSSPAFRK